MRRDYELDRRSFHADRVEIGQSDWRLCCGINEAVYRRPSPVAEVDDKGLAAPPAEDRDFNLVILRCCQGLDDGASGSIKKAMARRASLSASSS